MQAASAWTVWTRVSEHQRMQAADASRVACGYHAHTDSDVCFSQQAHRSQAKSAVAPNPIDTLSSKAKSAAQDAKAIAAKGGVGPDPVPFPLSSIWLSQADSCYVLFG